MKLLITFDKTPPGMHHSQLFDSKAHLDKWLEGLSGAGMIHNASYTKTKLKFYAGRAPVKIIPKKGENLVKTGPGPVEYTGAIREVDNDYQQP